MTYGDHIKVRRFVYCHHGIDLGDGWVIHFTGDSMNTKYAEIKREPLQKFLKGGKLKIVRHRVCLEPQEVVRRAIWLLGEYKGKYNLLSQNCEHIANWCKTGKFFCHQTLQFRYRHPKYLEDIMIDYEVYCN